MDERRHPLQLEAHGVGTGGQTGNVVNAIGVADGLTGTLKPWRGDAHGHTGQDGAALVLDRSGQRASLQALGDQSCGKQQAGHEHEHYQ